MDNSIERRQAINSCWIARDWETKDEVYKVLSGVMIKSEIDFIKRTWREKRKSLN